MQKVLSALALTSFLCAALLAQNSSLNGTVSDPSGAVVPNASVTLTNEQTGIQRAVTTDAQGRYTFDDLTPGTYRLSAKSAGLRRDRAAQYRDPGESAGYPAGEVR